MVMDLDEVFARPLSSEDFQRLRSAWKIPNSVPDQHIMKYINSQKSKGKRIGEDEVDTELNEIEDIQRRAGITTNWDRDQAYRDLKTIGNALSHLGNNLGGIEDEATRREFLNTTGECAERLRSIHKRLHLIQ